MNPLEKDRKVTFVGRIQVLNPEEKRWEMISDWIHFESEGEAFAWLENIQPDKSQFFYDAFYDCKMRKIKFCIGERINTEIDDWDYEMVAHKTYECTMDFCATLIKG